MATNPKDVRNNPVPKRDYVMSECLGIGRMFPVEYIPPLPSPRDYLVNLKHEKLSKDSAEITLPESKTAADAFAALYNHAKPLRMGHLHPNCDGPKITTELKALQKMYVQCRPYGIGNYYCDYVDGRPIKTSFSLRSNLNVKMFNQYHGNDAAQTALQKAKPLKPLQDVSLLERAKKELCALFTPDLMKASNFSEKDPELLNMFRRCEAINRQQKIVDNVCKKINKFDKIGRCKSNYTILTRHGGAVEHRDVECRDALNHISGLSENTVNMTIGEFSLSLYNNLVETHKFEGELSMEQTKTVLSAVNKKV